MQILSSRAAVNVQLCFMIHCGLSMRRGSTALLREPEYLLKAYCHVLHAIGKWRDGFIFVCCYMCLIISISSNGFLCSQRRFFCALFSQKMKSFAENHEIHFAKEFI